MKVPLGPRATLVSPRPVRSRVSTLLNFLSRYSRLPARSAPGAFARISFSQVSPGHRRQAEGDPQGGFHAGCEREPPDLFDDQVRKIVAID